MLISLLSWIIFGALAGWIASIAVGTNQSQGAVGNVMVGVLGAVTGGLIIRNIGGIGEVSGFNISSLIVAVIGSIILLALFKGFNRV